MKSLTEIDMLNIWEQAMNQSPLQRALILLAAAYPEMQPDNLARLSIGQRDKRLLQLREQLFGSYLSNTADCPSCSEKIEWENNIADFLIPQAEDNESINEFVIAEDDYVIRFRLPNSLDVSAIVASDADAAQRQLLSRCLLQSEYSGKNCALEHLPDSVIQKLIQRMEELDSQAEIRINLNCPECSHSWEVLFDIADFLWIEINDWAKQMLHIVHRLALGYGWNEREILNLSPVRRQLYLGMLG